MGYLSIRVNCLIQFEFSFSRASAPVKREIISILVFQNSRRLYRHQIFFDAFLDRFSRSQILKLVNGLFQLFFFKLIIIINGSWSRLPLLNQLVLQRKSVVNFFEIIVLRLLVIEGFHHNLVVLILFVVLQLLSLRDHMLLRQRVEHDGAAVVCELHAMLRPVVFVFVNHFVLLLPQGGPDVLQLLLLMLKFPILLSYLKVESFQFQVLIRHEHVFQTQVRVTNWHLLF